MSELLKLAGMIQLDDAHGVTVLDEREVRLGGKLDGRVVAVVMCAEMTSDVTSPANWMEKPRLTEPVLQVRLKFIVAASADERIVALEAKVAEKSGEAHRLADAASAYGRKLYDTEKRLVEADAEQKKLVEAVRVAREETDRARSALRHERERSQKMEANLGKLRGEIGEKEARRILGD